MIKKILLFIFAFVVLLSITKITSNAQTFLSLPQEYVQINLGSDTLLTHNGLTYVSGTVDWQKEGTYTVTYKDYNDNIYKKDYIIVLNKEKQYFLTSLDETNISFNNISDIVDIFYISDDSYYIIYNYQIIDPTYYDQEKIAVVFYNENQYQWIYTYLKYSRYVSGYLYNDNLIVTGTVYNENDNYNNSIVLFEITKDRQIIKQREINTNLSCNCYGLHLYDNYLYLITTTSGNTLDYSQFKKNNNYQLVLLKLSYESFKIIAGKVEDTLTDFRILDTSFYNNRLTVNISYKEDVLINNVEMTNCVYEYDEYMNLVEKYYLTLKNKEYLGYQVTTSEICFFSIDYNKSKEYVKVQYLNNGVEIKNIELNRENLYNINNIEVVAISNNDIYLALKYHKVSTDYFLGYAKVNSTIGVEYFSTTPLELKIIDSKINNNYIYNTYIKDDKLYYKSYNLLEVYETKITKNDYEVTRKNVVVNGNYLEKENYHDNANYSLYGKYINLLKFIDGHSNKYYFDEIINVKFKTNISNNETYQTGFLATFNSNATLNGKEVQGKYQFNTIGNYQLIITGENIDPIVYNLDIKDLTISALPRLENDFSISNIVFTKQVINDKVNISNDVEYTVVTNYEQIIPLALAILSFGLLSFVMLRKKI